MDTIPANNSQKNLQYSSALPWFIWFLAALFYLYENIIQVSPGVMVNDLMAAFSISSGALGGIIAFFFYSYAFMQIPVGVLVDNYDARILLTLATLSCVIGCLLFAMAPTLSYIAMGRLLIGFGAAFAAVCAMKLASNWFPAKRFSLLVGLMVTIGMVGSMIGEKPLAILVDHVGWRNSLFCLAGFGLILAVFILCYVRHSPVHQNKPLTGSIKPQGGKTQSLMHGLLSVMANGQSWIVAAYGGFMFASTSIFGGLWGVPFLMQTYSLDRPTAAGIVSMLFLGWVVGSPLSGILVNYFNSYKKILALSSVGALILMLALLFVPNLSLGMLDLLIFGFGLFSSFFLPSFTLMHDLHSDGNSGAALGFMNMANMVGGAIGQPLIGMLLDMTWDGKLLHNVRVHSVHSYQVALSLLPILIALSLALLPFIREPRSDR